MAGKDAFGITLERSDMSDTPTFAKIANITNVSGPEIERETYDVTAHDSDSGWREFVAGLKNAGEVTLELNFDASVHGTLMTDFEDSEARDYRIVFPNGTDQWELSAYMTGFSSESPVDDKQSGEVTLKVTGKPNLTTAS